MDVVHSLIFSLLLLWCAYSISLKGRYVALGVAMVSLAFGVGPLVLRVAFLPAVMIQGLLLTIGSLFSSTSHPHRFRWIGIGATVAAYVAVAIWTYGDILHVRTKFPFESMESRLPTLAASADPIGAEALEDLASIESSIGGNDERTKALRAVHELTVEQFLEQPGFGVTRMSGFRRSQRYRLEPLRPSPPPVGLDERSIPSAASEEDATIEIAPRRPALRKLHFEGVADFLSVERFGYFVDRKQVVGFEPHRFSEKPFGREQKGRRVELVGLVVHPQPVVYVSQRLPDMTDLARLPLRPLDAFETKGLAAIEAGDALYARASATVVRMLGPIRATKQCTECHGCERGRLLGAFSYVLE